MHQHLVRDDGHRVGRNRLDGWVNECRAGSDAEFGEMKGALNDVAFDVPVSEGRRLIVQVSSIA